MSNDAEEVRGRFDLLMQKIVSNKVSTSTVVPPMEVFVKSMPTFEMDPLTLKSYRPPNVSELHTHIQTSMKGLSLEEEQNKLRQYLENREKTYKSMFYADREL